MCGAVMLGAALLIMPGGCSDQKSGAASVKESDLPPLPKLADAIPVPEARSLLQDSRQAVETAPLDAQANGRFGMMLHAHDMLPEAATCYRRAIMLAPGELRWPYLLGVVQQTQGDADAAASSFEKVLSIRRSEVPALLRRAQIDMDRQRYAEAFERYKNAVGFSPLDPYAYLGAGEALLREGNPRNALQQFHFAFVYSGPPNQPAQWGRLQELVAETMTELGRTEEAERARALAKRQLGFEPPFNDPIVDEMKKLRIYRE